MKIQLVSLLLLGLSLSAFADKPSSKTTPYNLQLVNNSGKTLYIVSYQNPADTKSMMCPHFLPSKDKKLLKWDLNSIYYPQTGNYQNVILSFYVSNKAYSSDTPISQQGQQCNYDVSPKNGSLSPPDSQLIICGANKNGLSTTYKPGLMTITANADGSLNCAVNPYTHISEPMPYRVINTGQNYLPPIDGKYKGILPTRDSALLNIGAYMNYNNGMKTITAENLYTDMPDLITLAKPNNNQGTYNPNALLQIREGQLFIQRNLGSKDFSTSNGIKGVTFDSLKALCAKYSSKCSTTVNGVNDPNRFVLYPSIMGSITTDKEGTKQQITQTVPIVISKALRAKTVVELSNPRAYALIEDGTITSSKTGVPIRSWIPKADRTAPNYQTDIANALYPDGADPFSANPKDLLAISIPPGQSAKSIDLSQYFAPLSLIKSGNITYSLDASYLAPNPDVVKNYGVTLKGNSDYKNGVRQILGVNQASATGASSFSISGNKLIIQSLPNQTAVYQVSVKASTQTKPIETAYTTFYIYTSANGTSFSQWQQGALPNFNILKLNGKNFGTAYLYTSYDFTKDYARPQWENSIKTLLQDISLANNGHNAKIDSAFIDTNSLSFNGELGYWPLTGSGQNGQINNSINSNGIQTNLTDGLLTQLHQFLSKYGSGVGISLSIYPSNNLKANFTGFNPQQRAVFADMSLIPALDLSASSDSSIANPVNGISMDFEGGLNSVGNTQFYKLLADKLAFHGKWLAYFYFPTVISPAFSESLGPLGALQVSTYDVGTYRTPSSTVKYNNLPQQIIPNTVTLEEQGWSDADIKALYGAYFQDSFRCDQTTTTDTNFLQRTRSWCNNSTNMSYSESHRMWMSTVNATGLPYGNPLENLKLFNGKVHLILPVSWSATQFENLWLFNPDLTQLDSHSQPAQGLFMQKANDINCKKDAISCLFGKTTLSDQKTAIQTFSSGKIGQSNYYTLSGLPGTIKQDGKWTSTPINPTQSDYLNTNFALFSDINNNKLPHNLVGIGGYALMLFENVPAAVKANIGGIGTPTPNAALQSPWYVGLSEKPAGIPINGVDSDHKPGYDINTNQQIWETFGDLWQQIENLESN